MIEVYPPHPEGRAAPHPAAVWLDLTGASAAETRLVEDLTGLALPAPADLAEIEQSSRLAFENGVLRLTAPIIVNADSDHSGLGHIGLILNPRLLISIHDEPLRMVQAVAADAPSRATPSSSVALFVALLEAFVGRQADLLEEARARLDSISHQVFRRGAVAAGRAERKSLLMREKLQTLGRVGERASMIRESLLAVERMIPFALESAQDWFEPALAKRLGAVREDIGSLSLFEEHLLGKVQFLLDAVLGFIGIEQNDIFKVLTIASVVGIFPTLAAGWYGMNFHNMPEYGWAYGYQYGIGVIVLSTILPLLWFKWRGWL